MDTREAGSMGGKKVLQTHGREYFKMLSLKGVAARKSKLKDYKSEKIEKNRELGNI